MKIVYYFLYVQCWTLQYIFHEHIRKLIWIYANSIGEWFIIDETTSSCSQKKEKFCLRFGFHGQWFAEILLVQMLSFKSFESLLQQTKTTTQVLWTTFGIGYLDWWWYRLNREWTFVNWRIKTILICHDISRDRIGNFIWYRQVGNVYLTL